MDIAFSVALYLVVGTIVSALVCRTFHSCDEGPVPVVLIVFWPIALVGLTLSGLWYKVRDFGREVTKV